MSWYMYVTFDAHFPCKATLNLHSSLAFVAFLLNIVDAPEEDDSGFFSGYYKLEVG